MLRLARLRKIAWLWLAFASAAFAQMSAQTESVAGPLVAVSDTTIYAVKDVDVKPQFPGGDEAMYRWLADNINYPSIDTGKQFKIVVQFEISVSGKIENIIFIKKCGIPQLRKEIVRLIESMPVWSPGYVNGMPVRVRYLLPITFRCE